MLHFRVVDSPATSGKRRRLTASHRLARHQAVSSSCDDLAERSTTHPPRGDGAAAGAPTAHGPSRTHILSHTHRSPGRTAAARRARRSTARSAPRKTEAACLLSHARTRTHTHNTCPISSIPVQGKLQYCSPAAPPSDKRPHTAGKAPGCWRVASAPLPPFSKGHICCRQHKKHAPAPS